MTYNDKEIIAYDWDENTSGVRLVYADHSIEVVTIRRFNEIYDNNYDNNEEQ